MHGIEDLIGAVGHQPASKTVAQAAHEVKSASAKTANTAEALGSAVLGKPWHLLTQAWHLLTQPRQTQPWHLLDSALAFADSALAFADSALAFADSALAFADSAPAFAGLSPGIC